MNSFLEPAKVLEQLKLKENMVVADFGSGSGGWTIPLAKILKKEKIYAFDIQEEALSSLRSRARMENIQSIETRRCDLEQPKSTGLEDNFLDFVLIPNLLFQTKNKRAIIEEAKRILKDGGKILVLDWNPGAHLGPEESRVSEEGIKEIAKELDLKLGKQFKAGSYHFGLILVK